MCRPFGLYTLSTAPDHPHALCTAQGSANLADAAPPTGAERRRFYSRTTHEALREQRQHQHTGAHPYRVVLGEVRRKLMNTRRRMEEMLQGSLDAALAGDDDDDWYVSEEQLAQPLLAVYWCVGSRADMSCRVH